MLATAKNLILIRHAKSDWKLGITSDFDRTLNDTGVKEARSMAETLMGKQKKIDRWISSSAKRALETATIFTNTFGIDAREIEQHDALYLAPPSIFRNIICELPDEVNTVIIFSHNPGITDFANELEAARIDDMPTSAIFSVTASVNSWQKFFSSKIEFDFFDYPKNWQT